MKSRIKLFSLLLTLMLALAAAVSVGATQNPQSGEEEKTEKESKPKKKGGFFSGLKAITGTSTEQQEATATAGSKTVGEGEEIGDVQPTGADRQAVAAMEDYAVPANDLNKFQEDGQLKPKP